MILQTREAGAAAGAQAAAVCAECGTPATGNFCSGCGADMRQGSGVLGAVSGATSSSFPATYLRILRSPIKATVALADDPTYRQHVSFLLSGLAVFCVIMVPFIMQSAVPTAQMQQLSDSMQTLIKILSQVGIYVGAVITFVLAYALFRFFAKEPRSLKAYLKLYCLAFGFMLPPYAIYDYVARGLMHSTGLSSFTARDPTPEEMVTAPFLISLAVSLLIWAYFIAIHRRFWRMSIWKAGALYSIAAIVSSKLGYWLMFYAGASVTYWLIQLGVVTV
jgi:hypothetical protein